MVTEVQLAILEFSIMNGQTPLTRTSLKCNSLDLRMDCISCLFLFSKESVHACVKGWIGADICPYLGNTGMMLAPKKVGVELQEVVGTFLVAALVAGLGFGSLIGPSLVALL